MDATQHMSTENYKAQNKEKRKEADTLIGLFNLQACPQN